MTLEVIGASHKTSPLDIRERLTPDGDRLADEMRRLRDVCNLDEIAILATCNRIEYYFRQKTSPQRLGHYLAASAGLSREAAGASIYHHRGSAAARHLFSVASGLDSMVLGETEILAQCKAAYDAAMAAGTTGPVLNALFQRALSAAKRVHASTGICQGRVSVGSVAAELVRRELGTLEGASVLVVGAGAMAESALCHIAGLACSEVVVANRTPENGAALAQRFGGRAVGLGDLAGLLARAQVVVASLSGPSCAITRAMVEAACAGRDCPLLLLDISVPRKIDPSVASLPGVRLFNVDDLKTIADANMTLRGERLDEAMRVIDGEVASFENWVAQRQVVPVVASLRERAHRDAEREVEAALRNLKTGAPPEEEIRKLARRLTNKFLHDPLAALRSAAADGEEAERLSQAARKLYGIDDNGKRERAGE